MLCAAAFTASDGSAPSNGSDPKQVKELKHYTEDIMRIKNFLPTLAACALLTLMAVSAAAQVGKIEGDVKKQGTGEPVVGAQVDIVRTDMRGNYSVKTDKKGHFVYAGIPLMGTYTVLVSAEGCAPYYTQGVRPEREALTIELGTGDGRKLTIDDLKQAQGPQQQAGAKPMSEADIKKQQEEIAKIKAQNEKVQADFEAVKKNFTLGQELAQKKDFAGAISAFNEAIKVDAEQPTVHIHLALALFNRGATQLNAGQREPAKQDFIDSVASAGKALALIEPQINDPAKSVEAKKNKGVYLKIKADSESVLAARFSSAEHAEASVKDYQAAAELTEDPVKKKEYRLKAAKTLFEAGKSPEAIVAYQEILQTDANNLDALYSLGLAYSAVEKFQESANTLQKFLDKAPANDPRVEEVKPIIKYLIEGNKVVAPKADDKKGTPPKIKK
jgi:cytochrome c-type biogenesis protein CcmH/NrfG